MAAQLPNSASDDLDSIAHDSGMIILRSVTVGTSNNPLTCNDLDPGENFSVVSFVKIGTRLATKSPMMLIDVNSDSTQ